MKKDKEIPKDKKSRDIYKKNLVKLMEFIKKIEKEKDVRGNSTKSY